MTETLEEFETILAEEDKILDSLSEKQKVLRQAVTNKKWENLLETISDINMISDSFQHFDFRREEIQKDLKADELQPYFEKLRTLRQKLLKCSIENKALGSYVNVAKAFIQEIIEKALPQQGNRNYSKDGNFVKSQPKSVLVDVRG